MKERQRNKKGTIQTECSNCGKPIEKERLGKQRYCKTCHAEYMRQFRVSQIYIRKGDCGTYKDEQVEELLDELKKPEPINWEKIVALAQKVEKSKI